MDPDILILKLGGTEATCDARVEKSFYEEDLTSIYIKYLQCYFNLISSKTRIMIAESSGPEGRRLTMLVPAVAIILHLLVSSCSGDQLKASVKI